MSDDILNGHEFHVHHGDTIPHMATLPAACFDLAVFSPPFPTLYAYSSLAEDIGNSEDLCGEAKLHLSFFYRQLSRVLKPGRAAIVHVMQIPRMKRSGGQGLFDFRGFNIRLGERSGLVFEYDWLVRKNPQAQAIRTHSHELQFAGLERDRTCSRGVLSDYLIKFRAPGENRVAVTGKGEVSRNDWIEWAEGTWTDIRETDTLNVREGRGENDTKHICPLQLGVIDRCVRLFSDPGELVFDPFTGIGSTGYVSINRRRRFYGTETKSEYFTAAIRNLGRAIKSRMEQERDLFSMTA